MLKKAEIIGLQTSTSVVARALRGTVMVVETPVNSVEQVLAQNEKGYGIVQVKNFVISFQRNWCSGKVEFWLQGTMNYVVLAFHQRGRWLNKW